MCESSFSALRRILLSPDLRYLMEAHNGLSAKIVEKAGFEGIWASGFSIASALGVRDCNEASWTQVLEILEFMVDAVKIPILVDGDTGFGNFNNVRRLVRKLCKLGLAGVCLEDKVFPKLNSYIGEGQPLAGVPEFCGRLKAAKDSQTHPDFCVVARVEALVSGTGMDDALDRAYAYRQSGADAILLHSKHSVASEIFEFARRWENLAPIVIIPTTYSSTPVDDFRRAGISSIIWANHNLRASIRAMEITSRTLHELSSPSAIQDSIATLDEVFSLLEYPELEEATRKYQPAAMSPYLREERASSSPKDLKEKPRVVAETCCGQEDVHATTPEAAAEGQH